MSSARNGKISSNESHMSICGELVDRHKNMLEIISSRIRDLKEGKSEIPSHSEITRNNLVSDDDFFDRESDSLLSLDDSGESLGLINRSLGDGVDIGDIKSSQSLLTTSGLDDSDLKKKKARIRLSDNPSLLQSSSQRNKSKSSTRGKKKKKNKYINSDRKASRRKNGKSGVRKSLDPDTPVDVFDLVDQLQNVYKGSPGKTYRGKKTRRRKRKKSESVNEQIDGIRKDLEYMKKVKDRNDLRVLLIHQQIQEKQTEKQIILEKDELTDADRKTLEEIDDFVEDKKSDLFNILRENENVESRMKECVRKFEGLIKKKSQRLKMRHIVVRETKNEELEIDILKKELDMIKRSLKFSTYPYEMYELFLRDSFYKV